MKKTRFSAEAPFAYQGLDRVIHERARLSVLTSLITHPSGVSFVDLKKLCALTDGNLARHLQVLESEDVVRLIKEDDGARGHTTARLTSSGRKRFLDYLSTLEQVVSDATLVKRKADSPLIHGAFSPLKA